MIILQRREVLTEDKYNLCKKAGARLNIYPKADCVTMDSAISCSTWLTPKSCSPQESEPSHTKIDSRNGSPSKIELKTFENNFYSGATQSLPLKRADLLRQ